MRPRQQSKSKTGQVAKTSLVPHFEQTIIQGFKSHLDVILIIDDSSYMSERIRRCGGI